MNKILIIFYGGTGLFDKKDGLTYIEKQSDVENWLKKIPEISLMAKIDAIVIQKNRELISQNNIIKIVHEIRDKIEHYDGVLILHETDSIPTLANQLFWLIQNPKKPIVITGSNVIEQEKEFVADLSLRANLINAFQVINSNINEISVIYGNKVIQGNNVIRSELSGLNIFDSYNSTYLAKIDFGLSIDYKAKEKKETIYFDKLNNNFLFFEIVPEIELLEKIFAEENVRAIIFKSWPNQMINREKLVKIMKLSEENKKIAILYNPIGFAKDFFEYTILTISKISPECLCAKLSWALGQSKNEQTIRKLLKENIKE